MDLVAEWREMSALQDDLQARLVVVATRRAAVVHALIAEGRTVREVAALLDVSPQRVSQLAPQRVQR